MPKKNIHPKYYPKAVITCSCGAKFVVGSTTKKMQIEICSQCHPLYTGKQKFIDTAGRLERYKKRIKKSESLKNSKIKAKMKTKKMKKVKAKNKATTS
ncbi:50S ribosomal protein L31 [Candidatus Parcubacteria bacterium 4484_255]|nr:MAG: 50S ribosomal protein L31 [Candidatus Parcubacteria bacterium 4484_255]